MRCFFRADDVLPHSLLMCESAGLFLLRRGNRRKPDIPKLKPAIDLTETAI